jgi:hypothetical protein
MDKTILERARQVFLTLLVLAYGTGICGDFRATPALADSWASPKTAIYYSSHQRVRFTVVPGQWKSKISAHGTLERRGVDGRWTTLWDRRLLNDVSPVDALVSETGAYAVTFDNWHHVGLGENVVVIYGPKGELVRSLRLNDFLPENYVALLPRSISSLWWNGHRDGAHSISERRDILTLKVVVPSEREESADFVDRLVGLSSGRVIESADTSWLQALDVIHRLTQKDRYGER